MRRCEILGLAVEKATSLSRFGMDGNSAPSSSWRGAGTPKFPHGLCAEARIADTLRFASLAHGIGNDGLLLPFPPVSTAGDWRRRKMKPVIPAAAEWPQAARQEPGPMPEQCGRVDAGRGTPLAEPRFIDVIPQP